MDSIVQQVDMEITKIVATRLRMTTRISFLGYGLHAFVLKDFTPHTLLLVWISALVGSEIINHGLARHGLKHLKDAGQRKRYLRLQVCGLMLSGSCWGLSSWLPELWQQPLAFTINCAMLVLVGIFALHDMCLRWDILAAFSTGLIGPTVLLSLDQNDAFAQMVLAASVISLGLLQAYGLFARQLQVKQISSHFDMQKLTKEVTLKNEELLRLVEEVERLAAHDPLTNCLNRRALYQRYGNVGSCSPSSHRSGPLGVIMIDADHFKTINDRYGHETGDQVLVAMVGRIAAHLRSSDSLARWGGEEFLCVLPGVQMDGLQARAERIRSAIADYPVSSKSHSLKITASMGIALTQEHENFEETVNRADQALYQAKHSGRNRIAY